MISRNEIIAHSDDLKVNPSDIQRDYLFGWLLAGIYGQSELNKQLIFKGGNCFRKAYFQNARYSHDLDFSIRDLYESEYLSSQLDNVCEYVSQNTGVVFDLERTRIDTFDSIDAERKTQKVRLYFKDFFGNESAIVLAVRLDISEFDKIFLPLESRNLIHKYSDQIPETTKITCLKLEELLASKLKCLLQRRHSADLFDLVNATLLNPQINLDRNLLVKTFLSMTIFSNGPGAVKDLLINLPFQIIKGLWESYLVIPSNLHLNFDDAQYHFTSLVDELFGRFPTGYGSFSFFPYQIRNPIMQAGHDRTVLRLRYQGFLRDVEPYSLKYKTRQDGISREYFYAHDRTGGKSGPGIKAFVHTEISHIENTNIEFTPRREVELSKSGEYQSERYFQSPARTINFGGTTTYVVKCPVCGKQFRRKSYQTKLNPHKDQYGNRCYGRVGYVI